MACFHPLQAFKVSKPGEGDSIVFSARKKHEGATGALRPTEIACGQCFGCRLERSRQWAMRCLHEASLYDENCFVTLTYDNEHLPFRSQLDYPSFQLFMKRLRKRARRKIRFFMSGEYGEMLGRPHYHALLFNWDFPDKVRFRQLDSGCNIFTSKMLEELWPYGMSSIGQVTFESAAYVARYCLKKMTGPGAESYYTRTDSHGKYQIVPEFAHMSLKPGIGAPWLEKFRSDVYPHDYVVVNGQKVKPPKYYDKLYAAKDESSMEWIKFERGIDADARLDDNTFDRLAVKETVAKARVNQFKRHDL